MSTGGQITVLGAREHNLKDISLAIPRDALVVITGLSGSGKSSLAFDTIYAEGQRRYVESLSAYARQFLGQMDKPDVDSIEGLSPAISIDQKTTSRNPRSTVGTVTEIYDYLRLLWARIGKPHCHICGQPIEGQSIEQIVDQVMELPEGARFLVIAPIVRGRKGEFGKIFDGLRNEGYARVKVDGELRLLEEPIELDKRYKHDLSVVVDRLVMRGGEQATAVRKRLSDSVEAAAALSEGLVEVEIAAAPAEPAAGAAEGREPAESTAAAPGARAAGQRNAGGAKRRTSGARGARAASAQIIPGQMPEEGSIFTFSERFACPKHGPSLLELEPRIFSFNAPQGACPRCTGLGAHMEIDAELIIGDPAKPIAEGAILPWAGGVSSYLEQIARALAERHDAELSTPWEELPAAMRQEFLHGASGERLQISYRNRFGRRRNYAARFEGLIASLQRRYEETDSDWTRERIEQYMSLRPCPECQGARLRAESRAVLVAGMRIDEFCALSAHKALEWVAQVQLSATEQHVARMILREISERLSFLQNVGIGYLSMDRSAATLSGGEAQRIRLATQIGSSLVGVLYILDEPSIGLHQRDHEKLIATLERLRDLGNTVIVVEHDEQTMRAADHLVDLGPGAGEHGGHVIAEGTASELEAISQSLTGQFLAGRSRIDLPAARRAAQGELEIIGASQHNLREIDVSVPLGVFTCVTGVSGSGKSTLVNEVLHKAAAHRLQRARQRPGAHRALRGLEQLDKVIVVDQSPIGRTPRSNPATYTGLFDVIRDLFAKTAEARARGYKPGRFSFNVKGGRCEVCRGDGQIKIEMHFLPDVYVPCEQCHGRRYNRETLEVHFKGRSIADVLDLSVEQALEFFSAIPKIRRRLQTLADVGLGYVRLGQPATTLSGGEAQRIKLATELSKVATGRTLYILDEPTTGLHFADVKRLLEVLQRLVDAGNSIVLIEHNLEVIKSADWIIDMGPEGGEEGGMVVAAGTPEQVVAGRVRSGSHTGAFLADLLAPHDGNARRSGANGDGDITDGGITGGGPAALPSGEAAAGSGAQGKAKSRSSSPRKRRAAV